MRQHNFPQKNPLTIIPPRECGTPYTTMDRIRRIIEQQTPTYQSGVVCGSSRVPGYLSGYLPGNYERNQVWCVGTPGYPGTYPGNYPGTYPGNYQGITNKTRCGTRVPTRV